jgi:hypothetical protein
MLSMLAPFLLVNYNANTKCVTRSDVKLTIFLGDNL